MMISPVRLFISLLVAMLIISCSLSKTDSTTTENLEARVNTNSGAIAYTNGNWYEWTGSEVTFSSGDRYSVNGVFTSEQPANIDTTINLKGSYVVPPFGDAHNHAFADSYSVGFADDLFVGQGIFYALNLTNPYSGAQRVKDSVNLPTSIDVAYAHGGITAQRVDRPHPAYVMEQVYGYLVSDTTKQWPLEGNAYWFMDSEEEVKEKWPRLISQDPDVIKVYIMRYGENDPQIPECGYGLCPEELTAIVDSAHTAGKRVFAHVNTAKDFQLALDVGVDAISHLPLGNDGITIDDAGPLTLADSTIKQAGQMKITLTPTAHLLSEDLETFRTDTLADVVGLQLDQLQKLKEAGVTIALGADGWDDDPLREVMHLHSYEVFTNTELLKIWSQDTPKAIFPNRKFGKLADGYEASFIGLGCNPLENFTCVKSIDMLVKQGDIPKLPTEVQEDILNALRDMEKAFKAKDLISVANAYSDQGYIISDGEISVQGREELNPYWNNPAIDPIDWELTNYMITSEINEIYNSDQWKSLQDKPVSLQDVGIELPAQGVYQLGRSKLTYVTNGERTTSTTDFLLYWVMENGEYKIWADSY